ncbi:MAG: transaldolase [Spirochaetota bacterium]
MTKLNELYEHGQSVWIDYIERSFTRGGDLEKLVKDGLRGVTSNPTIFGKAIAGGGEYDDALREIGADVSDAERAYEYLATTDIREAADVFAQLYESSGRTDGFVSLEVSPDLASDTEGTIAAASRLFAAVARPNVMIKIPATPEGIPAIRATIAAGINVNVTLIFSLENYEEVAHAYISGIGDFVDAGGDPTTVASVASIFVSRIDVAIDTALGGDGRLGAPGRLGRSDRIRSAAVANSKLAFAHSREIFASPEWRRLSEAGAREQRLLWASTSTKNPALPDTFYVDNLIGGPTVNTMPPDTLEAFRDHGTVAETLADGLDQAEEYLHDLEERGVDITRLMTELQADGVRRFAESFAELLDGLSDKRQRLAAG